MLCDLGEYTRVRIYYVGGELTTRIDVVHRRNYGRHRQVDLAHARKAYG